MNENELTWTKDIPTKCGKCGGQINKGDKIQVVKLEVWHQKCPKK